MSSTKQIESISPEGEKFAIPSQEDYAREFERISRLADEQRAQGRGEHL